MELTQLVLPNVRKIASGKVREIFDLDDRLLLVATDRISAFDCVLPNAIPGKGAVLTQISAFWFSRFDFVKNHVIATEFDAFPDELKPFEKELRSRSMIVKKAKPLPIECVVRGYLAGSGWKEYQESGSVCGQPLPKGLRQAEQLSETMFTPSTKAPAGHDLSITWDECRRQVGEETAARVRELTIRIYEQARDYAREQGVIVADTKFEFGLLDNEVVWIDEALTPDSSRFWPADQYRVGASPPSFDKQFVRDYLETLDWDKTPPAPELPNEVVTKTSDKYREAFSRLTKRELSF